MAKLSISLSLHRTSRCRGIAVAVCVPWQVHSVSWSPYFAHAWYIMEFFARAGQEVAAITTLCIPPEAGAGAPGFAAAFPNVRSVSARHGARVLGPSWQAGRLTRRQHHPCNTAEHRAGCCCPANL